MNGCNSNKVVLINLPIQTYIQKFAGLNAGYNPSLGLIYLATYLELNGVDSRIFDLCYEKLPVKELLKQIEEIQPVLIGISAYTENINLAISFSKAIKASFPNTKILIGGPHTTLFPDEAINSEYVDFIIRKEGEASLLELVQAIESQESILKYEDIQGLVFKSEGKVIQNKLRGAITDLDLLPIPKREYMDISKYNEIVNVSTSRGCPAACIYCSATALSGATYRTRNEENVLLEMLLLKSLLKDKLQKVYIVDDTFTAVPERLVRFTEQIKKYDIDIPWHCESRIDIMTEELLDKMADAGCIAIQYGIESGSQEVLDKIRKNINLEYAKKIIDYTHKKGIIPCLSFMIGHFCDTKETMEETCKFIEELYSKYEAELALSYNTPFPGTWQHTNQEKIGLRLKADNYKLFSLLAPVVETDNFTLNDQRLYHNKVVNFLGRMSRVTVIKKMMEEV